MRPGSSRVIRSTLGHHAPSISPPNSLASESRTGLADLQWVISQRIDLRQKLCGSTEFLYGWRRPLPVQECGGIPLRVNAIRMRRGAPPVTTKRLASYVTPPAALCNLAQVVRRAVVDFAYSEGNNRRDAMAVPNWSD